LNDGRRSRPPQCQGWRTLGIGSAADVLNNPAVIAAYIGTQPMT